MKKGPEPHGPCMKEIRSTDVRLFSQPCSSQACTSQKSWVEEAASGAGGTLH